MSARTPVASTLRSLVDTRHYRPLGRETLLKPTLPSLRGKGLAGQGMAVDAKPSRDEVRGDQVDRLVTALSHVAKPEEAAALPQTTMPEPFQVGSTATPGASSGTRNTPVLSLPARVAPTRAWVSAGAPDV